MVGKTLSRVVAAPIVASALLAGSFQAEPLSPTCGWGLVRVLTLPLPAQCSAQSVCSAS